MVFIMFKFVFFKKKKKVVESQFIKQTRCIRGFSKNSFVTHILIH